MLWYSGQLPAGICGPVVWLRDVLCWASLTCREDLSVCVWIHKSKTRYTCLWALHKKQRDDTELKVTVDSDALKNTQININIKVTHSYNGMHYIKVLSKLFYFVFCLLKGFFPQKGVLSAEQSVCFQKQQYNLLNVYSFTSLFSFLSRNEIWTYPKVYFEVILPHIVTWAINTIKVFSSVLRHILKYKETGDGNAKFGIKLK